MLSNSNIFFKYSFLLIFNFLAFNFYTKAQFLSNDIISINQINNEIFIIQFDSLESLIRNSLEENNLSKEDRFFLHFKLATIYIRINDTINLKKEIDFCKQEILNNNRNKKLEEYLHSKYYSMIFDFKQAFQSTNNFLAFDAQINIEYTSQIYIIRGDYYYIKKDYINAESSYNAALKILRNTKLLKLIHQVYCKLAILKATQNDFILAHNLLDNSNKIADSCSLINIKLSTLLAQKSVHKIEGNDKAALDDLEKYIILNNQKNNIEDKLFINNNAKFENELYTSNNRINYEYWIALLSIFILLLLIYLYFKSRNVNKFVMIQTKKLIDKNQMIKKTLNQKEFLYRELNHRIKNNLQLITSMLNLQYRFSQYISYKDLIDEITLKINTIALTYAKMEVKDKNTNDIIILKDYINDIVINILTTISNGQIKLKMKMDVVNTSLDTAIPLGLIVNEILTNSIKHAFKNQPNPEIEIFLKEKDDLIYFEISDNGKVKNKKFELEEANTLGLKIINLLSKQLKAELKFDNSNGLKYSLIIKNLKNKIDENTNM